MTDTAILLSRVATERDKQDSKWGEQNHPAFYSEAAVQQFARRAESWKQVNEARVQDDSLSWDGILLEEVYEALAETEPILRVEELIQVAAVAVAHAEAIWRALDSFDDDNDDDICPVTDEPCERACESDCDKENDK